MALNKASKLRQAEALIKQNKLVEAQKLLQKVCRLKKNDFNAWLLLALTCRKLGQLNEAAKCCEHVIKRKPAHAKAWHLLGSCFHSSGDLSNAVAMYEKAISYDPEYAESYFYLGNAYRENANVSLAIEYYKKATKLKNNYLEALANLGATLREVGDLNEAWAILNQANTLKPDTPQILCNLALVHFELDQLDEALSYAKKANTIDTGFIDSLRILANIYAETGKIDDAINIYKEVITKNPADIETNSALASVYEKRKNYDDAHRLIAPLIDAKTFNHETLVTYSRLSENINVKHDAVKLLLDSINSNTISLNKKIDIHYELGRRFDREKKYDSAFHHYEQANTLTRQIYYPSVDKPLTDNRDIQLPAWTAELHQSDWNKLPVSTNTSRRPIFIVGMHRSGTSLTEQILSSHSSIYGAGEITKIPDIVSSLQIHPLYDADSYIDNQQQLTVDSLNQLADEYLNTESFTANKEEKIVDNLHNNFLHIGLIARMFPEAAFIHINRNPLDNCLSLYFQKFGLTLPYTTDLTESAIFYKKYQLLMQYWNTHLSANILNIQYEELVANQEETSKKMIQFCGMDWEDNCLNFHNTKRDVKTPSYYQVRQPIYTKSAGRWKHYEKHIQPLTDIFGE